MRKNKEDGFKEINIEQELYLHYHKQNYLDYKAHKNYQIAVEWPLIAGIYGGAALAWKSKVEELSNIKTEDGENLVEALGLIYETQGTNDVYSVMATDIVNSLKKNMNKKKVNWETIESNDDKISILDNYIADIKDLINTFNQGNEDYIKYILNKIKNPIAQQNLQQLLASGNDTMNLLNINSTARTAFNNLCKKVQILEAARKGLKSNSLQQSFVYNGETYNYDSFLFPSRQTFIDILGGLGEGLAATLTLQQLEDMLTRIAKKHKNMSLTIKGTGTEKASRIKGTKKADYEITIEETGKGNGKISLSFGVSVKAQALKKGKPVTTTFESSHLGILFAKYKMASNIEQYIFYNNLYHGIVGTLEMQYIRRKMAAIAICNGALTGLHQGENVLFIQYLDSLISIDKFFEELSLNAAKENLSSLPTIRNFGASKLRKQEQDFIKRNSGRKASSLQSDKEKDLTEDTKNMLAWVRSREKLKALQALPAVVTYKHDLT